MDINVVQACMEHYNKKIEELRAQNLNSVSLVTAADIRNYILLINRLQNNYAPNNNNI